MYVAGFSYMYILSHYESLPANPLQNECVPFEPHHRHHHHHHHYRQTIPAQKNSRQVRRQKLPFNAAASSFNPSFVASPEG